MNNDTITTILGAGGAGLMAAQPVMATATGALHQADYFQLALSLLIGLTGYFTNKKSKVKTKKAKN